MQLYALATVRIPRIGQMSISDRQYSQGASRYQDRNIEYAGFSLSSQCV